MAAGTLVASVVVVVVVVAVVVVAVAVAVLWGVVAQDCGTCIRYRCLTK